MSIKPQIDLVALAELLAAFRSRRRHHDAAAIPADDLWARSRQRSSHPGEAPRIGAIEFPDPNALIVKLYEGAQHVVVEVIERGTIKGRMYVDCKSLGYFDHN